MGDLPKYSCTKCGVTFKDNYHLKRHLERKSPCTAVVDRNTEADGFTCRLCGRAFKSKTSMYRHIRQNCSVTETLQPANQRRLAEQAVKVDALQMQLTKLTALLENKLAVVAASPEPASSAMVVKAMGTTKVNTGPVTNNVTQIAIHPWAGKNGVVIPVAMLHAAFDENPRLAEYCSFSDREKVDAELAAPYVLEALVDLVRRAHADPAARNIHMNPRRADQVMT